MSNKESPKRNYREIYNMSLRSSILLCSIREENEISRALKYLLRTVRPDSKTLDNKSSSLSFKNKVDLLYDIGDLEKSQYDKLILFMEIRNQFIHNPNCNSFVNLSKYAPETDKNLKNKFPNKTTDTEASRWESFGNLFLETFASLIELRLEYRIGYRYEMDQYVNARAMENINFSFKNALIRWKTAFSNGKKFTSSNQPSIFWPTAPSIEDIEAEIRHFEYHLTAAMIDDKTKILDKISNGELTEKEVFKRRAIGSDLQGLVAKSVEQASATGIVEEATEQIESPTERKEE
ncbi:hypothetical protein H8B15_18910 [Hymenobacter sp. BT507]|uniref:Apea-like HEPN domain-containing protein n=1 Tax=Hymenobacter citatus TaxID=2763506 RepID=A0ABR7MQL4_9BACT|nr:hypothetical protein [Hymenobacter citatus]MBC6613000.1 hypothetical protein [Hymenobacter citatus]